MKRLLLVLMVLLLAMPVVALTIDFQEESDLDDIQYLTITETTFPTVNASSYVNNITAGNSYIRVYSGSVAGTSNGGYFITSAVASPTTYAAGTMVSTTCGLGCQPQIVLLDANKNILFYPSTSSIETPTTANTRIEVVITGSVAKFYANGVLYRTSGTLTQNPTYVAFGTWGNRVGSQGGAATVYWDDLVFSQADDPTIIGMPAAYAFYLKKDMINPAASGLYNATTGGLVYSTHLPFNIARSINVSGPLTNDTIYLINERTGTVYSTLYTGTASPSIFKNFDIDTYLISAGAPYGFYQIKSNTTLSNSRIAFIANGANINFDKSDYSQGDSATVTYLVDSEYWLPGEYAYRIDITDVYGTVHHTENIATSEGDITFTWDADEDTQGVYYAEIIADRISDGADILMKFDYATLTAYFGFTGYVNAAQTALPIEAANVTYAQGDTVETDSSGFDGNYSVSGFLAGIPIWANVSADGYETQNFTFTVSNGHTITRNITLNETTPSYTGLGIGGVARDGIFTSPNSITNGYGRPIATPICYLLNTTHSESYTTTGNNAGGYLFDESTSAILTTGRVYDLWCQRSGYGNSPNYTVVAA